MGKLAGIQRVVFSQCGVGCGSGFIEHGLRISIGGQQNRIDGAGDNAADGRETAEERTGGGRSALALGKLVSSDNEVRVGFEPAFGFERFGGELQNGPLASALVPIGGVFGAREPEEEA